MVQEELLRVERTYRRIGRRWMYNALSFAGFQGWEAIIRKRAVASLELSHGDTVLDVACGRGANLPYLLHVVGSEGWVLGIDCSATMLAGASELVRKKGWENVALIQGDAAQMAYSHVFDGALCTLGLTVIPQWQEALERMVAAVKPGKLVVIFDGRLGRGLKRLWNAYYRLLSHITAGDLERAIPEACRRLLADVREETLFLSNAYIVSGRRPLPELRKV